VSLALGARYDAISYYNESHIDPKISGHRTFSRVTPKIGLNVRVSDAHSVYANVGGGVEAPAGNETDPVGTFGDDTVLAINPLLDPIRSTTFELGTKHVTTLGGADGPALSYDAALYHTDVRNEIVPYRGGRFYYTAGRVRRTGAELGVELGLQQGLTLRGAFTYARNTYAAYVVDSVHYGRPGAFADYSGNRVVGLPNVIFDVGTVLRPPAWRWVRLELDARGQGSYFADDANAVTVPSFTIVNATLGLGDGIPLPGRFELRGFVAVNNITDRRYIESSFLNPDIVGGVPMAYEPGLPRHVVVSLSLGVR
jgi:iron complex outermembrane receptor protein